MSKAKMVPSEERGIPTYDPIKNTMYWRVIDEKEYQELKKEGYLAND